ncbi:hypothetical protein [Streptomyces sp. NPDC088707]|uniref:hypothetical protein n=1 Tax=Streptomyces sp. NPDC088707 TaxID=3365871 RepID=UPI003821D5D5
MEKWRFIAQRALGGTILDWDVPLALSSNPRRELSGPGSMTGTIEPEYQRMMGSDGKPLIQEWGTKIFLEIDGAIRWGGIVTRTAYENQKATIQCEGFTAYPHGIPYEGHMISGPLITPKDPYAGRDKNHDGWIDGKKGKQRTPKPPKPYGGARFDVYDAVRRIWSDLNTRPYGNIGLVIDTHDLGEPLGAKDGSDPWELAWWDHPDCGQTIDTLARLTPFDWREEHYWAKTSGNAIAHRLRLGRPRLGRRRTDLRFADSENVIAIARPEGMGDEYANEAVVLGKGEGRKMARSQVAAYDGRMRRVVTISDKTLSSSSALAKRGRAELAGRTKALQIPRIQVIDHANARFGSWQLGDDIRVQVRVPWVGDIDVWHRVVADEVSANGIITLDLRRSDSFVY